MSHQTHWNYRHGQESEIPEWAKHFSYVTTKNKSMKKEPVSYLTAKGAKGIVSKYVKSKDELLDCLNQVIKHANRGRSTCLVDRVDDYTVKELKKLGYKIEDRSCYHHISW